MAEIDEIIELSIDVQDKAPEKPSFSTALIAGYHNNFVDKTREYEQPADMLDDGFLATDDLYLKAQTFKQQDNAPRTFKVGKLSSYTQIIHLTPNTTVQGTKLTAVIGGTTIEYNVPGAATIESIVTAVQPLADALASIAATEDNLKIIATSSVAGKYVSYDASAGWDILDATADPGIAADLAAIADEDNDWYALLLVPQSEAIIAAAAAWVEANKKIYVPQSADTGVITTGTTTDIASDLMALAYTRTAGIYHRKLGGTENLDAAWLAPRLVAQPGSETWALKGAKGVTVDKLKTAHRTSLKNKRWTRFTRNNGLNLTFEGKTPSGRFIDVTHFIDWLYAEIQADQFFVLANDPKVPFSTAGITKLKGTLENSLRKGIKVGGLSDEPAPLVSAPTLAETDPIDRINRRLKGLAFTARGAGAIHGVTIKGVVNF
jgi:hypothetical protein